MKKTLNINLAGYPFTIDEDAYQLLKDYLDTIRYAFDTKTDTEDLASDIEARIAEILIEKEDGNFRIVSLGEISQVIERIGKPSQFIEIENVDNPPEEEIRIDRESSGSKEEESINFKENLTPPPYRPFSQSSFRKKLFRDPQNAMLGGVCSGLAMFLNLDTTIVRLITVALFFLSASTVAIAYIILWLVVPDARTPIQRIQMRGEDPTVENIGKNITENYREDISENNDIPKRSGFWKFVYNCCSIFVKFLIVLGLFIAIPVVLALLLVLVACIVALCAGIGDYNGPLFGEYFLSPGYGKAIFHLLLAVIGALITIGIPLWLIFNRKMKRREITDTLNNRRSLVLLWLAGIALVSVFTPKTAKDIKRLQSSEFLENVDFMEKKNKIMEELDLEDEDIQHLSISKNGITIIDKKGRQIIIGNSGVIIEKDSIENANDTLMKQNIMEIETLEEINVKKEKGNSGLKTDSIN